MHRWFSRRILTWARSHFQSAGSQEKFQIMSGAKNVTDICVLPHSSSGEVQSGLQCMSESSVCFLSKFSIHQVTSLLGFTMVHLGSKIKLFALIIWNNVRHEIRWLTSSCAPSHTEQYSAVTALITLWENRIEVAINSAIVSYVVSTGMPKNYIFGVNIIRCLWE